ncbi:hypothetical protein Tco_0476625, partial [Tanacetum coccineum]
MTAAVGGGDGRR